MDDGQENKSGELIKINKTTKTPQSGTFSSITSATTKNESETVTPRSKNYDDGEHIFLICIPILQKFGIKDSKVLHTIWSSSNEESLSDR